MRLTRIGKDLVAPQARIAEDSAELTQCGESLFMNKFRVKRSADVRSAGNVVIACRTSPANVVNDRVEIAK